MASTTEGVDDPKCRANGFVNEIGRKLRRMSSPGASGDARATLREAPRSVGS